MTIALFCSSTYIYFIWKRLTSKHFIIKRQRAERRNRKRLENVIVIVVFFCGLAPVPVSTQQIFSRGSRREPNHNRKYLVLLLPRALCTKIEKFWSKNTKTAKVYCPTHSTVFLIIKNEIRNCVLFLSFFAFYSHCPLMICTAFSAGTGGDALCPTGPLDVSAVVPGWTHQPDLERVEWLNTAIAQADLYSMQSSFTLFILNLILF